jgi:hypothetical protein
MSHAQQHYADDQQYTEGQQQQGTYDDQQDYAPHDK